MNQAKKILIVDSDQFTMKVFDFALKKAGFDTCTANDGNSAIEAIKKYGPRLVFTEIIIPPPNGFELMERYKDTSFVVVTSLEQKSDIDKAYKLGAKNYITKEGLPTRTIIEAAHKLMD